ncbi:MAG: Eco57I restriction-modification methylase domain-containing protein, partial [bacterium]
MRDNDGPYTTNALIIFSSKNSENYRFSLLTTDYKREGKKTTRDLSNPRRFSFYLGPEAKIKTPKQFLIDKGAVRDIDDLKSRFSVEVVNKEFYENIQTLYYDLMGIKRDKPLLTYPDEEHAETFAIRLLGRVMFSWFLKKKKSDRGVPLIPDAVLSLETVRDRKNFYHFLLEPLFFEIMNTPKDKRNYEFLAQYNLDGLHRDIPFLNGGLFEPDETIDKYRTGDQPSQPFGVVEIPDSWFISLFEVLDLYNFTVDENTMQDIDLSVDPEMLGRIFENLLAEVNPETQQQARNDTGSFYTPRPIVEYMVDASLKEHLKQKTELTEQELSSLLSYAEERDETFSKEKRMQVIEACDSMTVIDPACGSGAFPMGMLQKTALILEKVDEESIEWTMKMLEGISNPVVKHAVEKQLENEDWRYIHKLGMIQKSIYGVDKQPIAVELSRLRFFLSLIVDAKIDDTDDNRGIKALPNLDFKFVCADTLTRFDDNDQGTIHENHPAFKKLHKLRENYFESSVSEKEKIKNEFLDTQKKLAADSGDWAHSSNLKNKATWNPFNNDPADFFVSKWMFGVEDGFDVVIGNPPFIQLQKNDGILGKKYHEEGYSSYAKTGDIYALFYERGNELLKNGGHLCYITSNKWMRAKYGEKLRKYLSDNTDPEILIDFGGYKVFDSATVDTNILLFQNVGVDRCVNPNNSNKDRHTGLSLRACKIRKDFKQSKNIPRYVEKNSIEMTVPGSESWIISTADELLIKRKIEEVGTPLKEWNIEINYGIKTGYNKAFIISGEKKNELIAEDPKSAEIIKPILRGRDIKKYKAEFADKWLVATFPSLNIDIEKYPAVKKHLEKYIPKLKQTGEKYIDEDGKSQKTRKKTGNKWFETQDQIGYYEEFEKEKIVYPDIMRLPKKAKNYKNYPYFFLDKKSFFAEATNFIMTGDGVHLIVSILSSALGVFAFTKYFSGPQFDSKGFRYKKEYLNKFPIPQISVKQQKPFEKLVDYILFLKGKNI